MEQVKINDTIAAISTPPGTGGIAVIRVSGPDAISIVNNAWKGSNLSKVETHSLHYGKYFDLEGKLIDEGVVAIFKTPSSYTGEDTVEINVHGSSYIQKEILSDLIKRGIRIADPGEFTQRAFINGKLDLAQAEGVADLIASSSKAAHDLALTQTKGEFSKEFNTLRDKLIEFASLLELELDFSEEDVEFADRENLITLCNNIITRVKKLADSYSRGAVLKGGVPVVIAGLPNAGKSSILNLILNEEKAIVTDIPGTTRDTIEGTEEIGGILFRFIDTAGIRETQDVVEKIGVEKAKTSLEKAYIIIWVIDSSQPFQLQYEYLQEFKKNNPDKKVIILRNKTDLNIPLEDNKEIINFSALTKTGHQELLQRLQDLATEGQNIEKDIIVTNARHYEALIKAERSLSRALQALSPDPSLYPVSADFIAQDIREAISYLSTISGTITTDNLLHSIFSHFCIGK